MKKEWLISLVSAFVMMPFFEAQADEVVRTFQLTDEGQLSGMLAETGNDADSVEVSGPMNVDDMQALRIYCRDGHVRGVNISKVVFENDSLPMKAFGWTGIDNPVENITLPEGLRVIGPYAFYFMGNLKHIELPATLQTICYSAFFCCLSLRSVTLPEGLREIQSQAFSGSGLEELTIPKTVTKLRYGIADDCLELKTLTILGDVGSVPDGICNLCPKLETVVLPDNIKLIGTGAFEATALKDFHWPTDLETIASTAFCDTQMEEVVLPPHVSEIGNEAFRSSSVLRSITLPASLLTISQSALAMCPNLETVSCMAAVPPTTTNTQTAPQAVLYVPEQSVEAYRADPWWGQFKEIRGFTPSAVSNVLSDMSHSLQLYHLDGTRASGMQHGVCIKSGRKYVVR